MYRIKYWFVLLAFFIPAVNADLFDAKQALEAKDFVKAEALLLDLAKVGNENAQESLGLLYYQGQLGSVDKYKAFSWLMLAAENNHPSAQTYANKLYSELTSVQQQKALNKAKKLARRFGHLTLLSKIYPLLKEQHEVINNNYKPAKEIERIEFREDDPQLIDREAEARRKSAEQTAELIANLNKGYRHNAYDNFDKFELEEESSLTVVKHGIDEKGKVLSPEVIFSWPYGKYDEPMIKSIEKSTFSPASIDGQAVKQNAFVSERRVGVRSKNSFRTQYPQKYKYFLKMKKESEESTKAKYIYANMLRAYHEVIGAKQPKPYDQLLLELAEDNFILAQFDYAQFLIYQKKDIDKGLYWLLKAAKFGLTDAEYRLGDVLYQTPSPLLIEDEDKALFWLERAAKKGHEKAKKKLIEINNT